MAATFEWRTFTSTNAATELPATGSAANVNMYNQDSYDSSGTTYQSYPVTVPVSGTAYSFERWIKGRWSSTFNLIENIKFWKSAGSYSDAALSIKSGVTDTGVTPVSTASSVATATVPVTEGTADDISPTGDITSSPGYSDFEVLQLNVPSTVVTPGDIGTQTFTIQYDES